MTIKRGSSFSPPIPFGIRRRLRLLPVPGNTPSRLRYVLSLLRAYAQPTPYRLTAIRALPPAMRSLRRAHTPPGFENLSRLLRPNLQIDAATQSATASSEISFMPKLERFRFRRHDEMTSMNVYSTFCSQCVVLPACFPFIPSFDKRSPLNGKQRSCAPPLHRSPCACPLDVP